MKITLFGLTSVAANFARNAVEHDDFILLTCRRSLATPCESPTGSFRCVMLRRNSSRVMFCSELSGRSRVSSTL